MADPNRGPDLRPTLWEHLKLRWKRRRLLWRAIRARHDLRVVSKLKRKPDARDQLLFAVVRNEAGRLPYFLKHYRALGVQQFFIIDNGSDDGTLEILQRASDVALWQTSASYRAARFGLDWTNWLLMRYGHGHWCLTVDADELLVLPQAFDQNLRGLTQALEAKGQRGFGALMLDLCPKGPLGSQVCAPDQPPTDVLPYFDAGPYRAERQMPLGNLWVQGGLRERKFFLATPHRSPTLNKLPLVKWNRRWAYVNSTHSMLPRAMNFTYDGPGGDSPGGVLLHTKFLPEIVAKSETEKARKQHFMHPELFDAYYSAIEEAPELWDEACMRYQGTQQLEVLGLMGSGRGRHSLQYLADENGR